MCAAVANLNENDFFVEGGGDLDFSFFTVRKSYETHPRSWPIPKGILEIFS